MTVNLNDGLRTRRVLVGREDNWYNELTSGPQFWESQKLLSRFVSSGDAPHTVVYRKEFGSPGTQSFMVIKL